MKVAILAGGLGTRISKETATKPKAMVKIGNEPILWHIMNYYAHFGFTEFVIALGYKGECIKKWMTKKAKNTEIKNIQLMGTNATEYSIKNETTPDLTVHLVETGQNTPASGRIKRLSPFLGNQTFMLTYCDGLADVDLKALKEFHESHGKLATVIAVKAPSRFGHLFLEDDTVVEFQEKPILKWINGAFFVLNPEVIKYIEDDNTDWEKEALPKLASDKQLMAFRHEGFWQCMDTLKEKLMLEKIWQSGSAPWKTGNQEA